MNGYDKIRKIILGKAEQVLDDDRDKEILHNRLIRLTRRQMRLLTLYYFESKSVKTIAKMMRKPQSTIYDQIRTIVKRLKVNPQSCKDAPSEQEQPPQS